jgi:tetratricopeptide (TPR) repeat protein
MYQRILGTFDFDKQAGLEYAAMEMSDLANYEQAETVDRRFVLDHYINDKDGLLLLGDIFLEWATEKDPSKFESAREQYASLVQLYGPKDLYLSRMMRYFIRTDNLREVLKLKEHFLRRKKSLGAQDLTELSGYLLDKEYGRLAPSDEYLRSSIEDVRTLLERAVDADPSNPDALYNMSRYFVKVANFTSAIPWLEKTITAFEKTPELKKKDVYKQIDSYYQLGNLYSNEHKYIQAQETYGNGIGVFEKDHDSGGLEGNSTVGHLYAGMADLDYFISGDLDSALRNYGNAIANLNDTPSIRYRIGAIQYGKKDYAGSLGSFIKAAENVREDNHLLMALGNVLTFRNDDYAAEGYYEDLLGNLDILRERRSILLPQVRDDDAEIVDLYMKAANNLGVVLYRLARQTGNSDLNAQAIVHLTESLRAWDALTRNQNTLVRLGGSNLALQNIQYITHPQPAYEPAVYADIPRTLSDERGLQQ